MGKGSESRQDTRQDSSWNNKTRPPEWSIPGFKGSTDEANRIYQERKGSQMPGLSEGTRDAINGLGGLPGQWQNPSNSENNLGRYADGSMVGNNEQFQNMLNNQLGNISSKINQQFAAAGRSGSGANAGTLGRELGNAATTALANQYNQDINNQFRANDQMDQYGQNRLRGQGDAWGNALRGSSVQDKWNQANDQRGWDELQRWQDALGRGTGGGSDSSGNSSSTGSTTQKKPGNIWGDIGSVVGGIGGSKGKSDIRAKENIVPLGMDKGFMFYEFNYKGMPERYSGIMAQDIMQSHPEAISIDKSDGLMMVDYGMLGIEMKRVH